MLNRTLVVSAVLLAFPLSAFAGSSKVNVCHNGRSLNVSSSAVGGHTGHGDWLVASSETCEDGVDNDCDGVVDDGCPVCPCFTEHDLLSWFGSNSGAGCYDYTATSSYGNGTYLAYYGGQGLEAGVADYYYTSVPFCAAVNLTTFAGPFVAPITTSQYDQCSEIVLNAAAQIGLSCVNHP